MDVEKLKALFRACDKKGTGYIGREDLREICSKFGILAQESDGIFDDLDHDQDDQICFSDFARGFSDFLSSPASPTVVYGDFRFQKCDSRLADDESYLKDAKAQAGHQENEAEREIRNVLQAFKEELGEKGNLSEEKLLELYQELHASEKPQLVSHLESVLDDMMSSMKRLQTENQRLEQSWRREREDHEKYLQKIEEEMDSQVQKVEATVKEQAREEVEAERRALKSQMDSEMDELQTHLKLFQKVDTWLKTNQDPETDSRVKVIRTKLEDAVQDNRQLRMNLMDTQTNIALMRSELSQLKTNYEEKCRELHEEKEKVMEYMHEQDYLSRQLHLLHDANRRLQDTNDGLRNAMEKSPTVRSLRNKRGSIVGTYLSDEADIILSEPPKTRRSRSKPNSIENDSLYGSEGWEKRSRGSSRSRGSTMDSGMSTMRDNTLSDPEYEEYIGNDPVDEESTDEEQDQGEEGCDNSQDGRKVGDLMKKRLISRLNIKPQITQHSQVIIPIGDHLYDEQPYGSRDENDDECSENGENKREKQVTEMTINIGKSQIDSQTEPPMPKKRTRMTKASEGMGFVSTIEELDENSTEKQDHKSSDPVAAEVVSHEPTGPPDTTYKVVFVGDAAVGKSSFIIRLSKGMFVSNLSSTLGVDFQMKTLNVDRQNIAVQLWDTAGQERFRSITQSYFRRADGIMLLYDCTSERTFLNVRDWVEAIKDVTDRNIPVILCANKIDLREDAIAEGRSVVREEDGQRLAKENEYIFVEASAKNGSNVVESMVELIRTMGTNENMELQATGLKVNDEMKRKKSSSCCK